MGREEFDLASLETKQKQTEKEKERERKDNRRFAGKCCHFPGIFPMIKRKMMKIEMNRCNSERNRNQKSLIAGLTLRAVVRKRRLNIFWVTQPVKSGPLPPLLHRSRSLRFPIATVRDSIPGGAASLPNCLLYFRNSAEIEH